MDNLAPMRIGQLAGLAGIAPSAIRFYEQSGLLPPPERTAAGYRDYDRSALDRLQFIRSGQAVGLTLGELRDVLRIRDRGEAPCHHVAGLIDHRIEEVDRHIDDLRRLRTNLVELAADAATLHPTDCPPDSVCWILTGRG